MSAASHPIRALGRGLLCLALALTGLPARVAAQSLGDVAQKEKARREKEHKVRPPRVYTDEDLPKAAASGGAGESAPNAPATNPNREAEGGGEGVTVPSPSDRREESGGESGVDGRAAQAQAALGAAQAQAAAADAEVERLKQFLNPMSTLFVTDPYQIIKVQSDLTQAQQQAAAAHQEVQAAQKAMDEVTEEARRAGVRLPK